MEEKKSLLPPLFINSFAIKIIALVLMTIDHVLAAITNFGDLSPRNDVVLIIRGICRIAYPLFCFMIFQGVIHTKKFSNYALKLGICASAVSLGMIAVEYLPLFEGFTIRNEGIVFLDLLLGALAVYCLRHKKIYVKLLAFLPLAYSIISTFASGLECAVCGSEIWFIPFFMRTQYDFYGVLMMILIYFGYELSKYILSKYNGAYDDTKVGQFILNIGMIFGIVVAGLLYYFFQINQMDWFDLYLETIPDIQLIALFAVVIILFYNNRPGFNKVWFRHGCYLYYIVHLIIIYVVFMIIYF